MGEEYWEYSKKQSKIFDSDDDNSMDRYKTRLDPEFERILDSSRLTAPTTGVASNRFGSTRTNPPPLPSTPPRITNTQPNIPVVPASPVARTVDPPTGSARLGRLPPSTASTDSHSNAQWTAPAEEYLDPSVKDRTTQFDTEMRALCRELFENKSVKLDYIRDYDRKASLLRIAVLFNTPSVIVPVMIFLENTLSRPLFYELVKQHPSAVHNYINMAKSTFENDYHIAMLKQFGRNEDAAMIRLRQASQTSNLQTKMAILDQAAAELASHPWWHLQVAEQRILLLKQREGQNSQSHRTVLEAYKAVYKDDFLRSKNSRNSNKTEIDRCREYESTFHMSPEMIMVGKLTVIMHCGLRPYYNDFVHQAIHQGLFGKKYIIAPEYLADMVHNWVLYSGESQEKASERTEQFLKMIVDPNKRIYFAEKFQNYEVAIDTIANVLRDRVQLDNLRRRMPRNHPGYNQATALLENTKWRN